MDTAEAIFLELEGYIPENVQACRDYKAGLISLKEMFYILHSNIDLSKYVDHTIEKSRPREKDRVNWDGRWGHIVWIDWRDENVRVWFYDTKEGESLDLGLFQLYDSTRGHTTWIV